MKHLPSAFESFKLKRDAQEVVERQKKAVRTGMQKSSKAREQDARAIEAARRKLLNKYKLT